ncbi:MAG: dTDP-4-amino-4,6-dideoxygalactose transaminase [Microthrixaceae bacterium]
MAEGGPAAPPGAVRFNRPTLMGRELELVADAMDGGWTGAAGPYSRQVEAVLSTAHAGATVLMCTSCTAALELAAATLNIGDGDVVAVPSFSFVTTASAFARTGARLRFIDIDEATLGMDPDHLATQLDDRVKAVVPVHYAGVPAAIGRLVSVADSVGAAVVEDNAHGLFAARAGQPLGTFGRMSTLSFHETKNFICGEGGALVLNDPDDVERAEILLHKGTDRRSFDRGQVDKYTWQLTGSSFGLSDVLAAYLLGQLEAREEILRRREALWRRYHDALAPRAGELGLVLPAHSPTDRPAWHMFHLLVTGAGRRDGVLARLNSAGIGATIHYQPLHRSPEGSRVADRPADCPVSERVAGQLLRLPFHNRLSEDTADRVLSTLTEALEHL